MTVGKMYIHELTCLRTGTFQQFSQIVDIGCGRIAEYAISKAPLTPRFHIERKLLCHRRSFVPSAPKGLFLEDEYRNLLLPHGVDQMRPWCLAKVRNAAT